jgi:hypothetical protein
MFINGSASNLSDTYVSYKRLEKANNPKNENEEEEIIYLEKVKQLSPETPKTRSKRYKLLRRFKISKFYISNTILLWSKHQMSP